MRKVNKKRIGILIILLIIIIIQIKAFTGSKADKLLDIDANIIDNSGLLENQKYVLEASNEGKQGYVITLPTEISDKLIKSYIVDIKEIDEENTNKKQGEITLQEKKPGERLYLTSKEVENKSIELKVEYDKKQKDKKILYNKILKVLPNKREQENKDDKNKIKNENLEITLKGYMPADAILKIEEVKQEKIQKNTENYINERTKFDIAYDIKIISQDKEYEPKEFDENVEVTFANLDEHEKNKNYKVLHIDRENKTEEIKKVEVEENTIKFNAKEFSVYALLSEEVPKEKNSTQENEVQNADKTIQQEQPDEQIATLALQTKEVIVDTSIPWNGTTIASKFSFGKGTISEPYLITDASELAYLRQQVNSGNTYEGQYFQIATDIDIGNKAWTPIGNQTNQFRGILDGAGHTVCNAVIKVNSLPDKEYIPYGIFGSIGGGNTRTIIKNVELSNINVQISASGNTGSSSFFGVTQDAEGLYIGTLVGTMDSNASIQNTIVKNSAIQDTNVITITDSPFRFAVGGIVRIYTK